MRHRVVQCDTFPEFHRHFEQAVIQAQFVQCYFVAGFYRITSGARVTVLYTRRPREPICDRKELVLSFARFQ